MILRSRYASASAIHAQRPRVRSRILVPCIYSHLIDDIKKHIPEIVKDRVRIAEVAAGRAAICGLFVGTATSDIKGVTFQDQVAAEEPFVIVLVLTIAMLTIIPNIEKGIKKKRATRAS